MHKITFRSSYSLNNDIFNYLKANGNSNSILYNINFYFYVEPKFIHHPGEKLNYWDEINAQAQP